MKITNSLIWQLIEESFKDDETRLYKLYTEWFTDRTNAILDSHFLTIKEFLINKYGERNYGHSDEMAFVYKLLNDKNGIIKVNNFDIILEELVQYQIEKNKWKLKYSVFSTLGGVNITNCNKISFKRSVKGFQGTWGFTTAENETAIFETKAVFASGPIKCDHYRYISHIIGNTNIQSDNRLRNEILKALKAENPEEKKKLTPEEKELKKRIESAEAEVRNSKSWHVSCLNSIERDKKYLVDLSPEKLLGVEEGLREEYYNDLKIKYTKDVQRNDEQLPLTLKRVQKAEEELAKIKATDLISIGKELQLKADKKLIKELKEKRDSYSMGKLKLTDINAYNEKLKGYTDQLNVLYEKYPDIKIKETKARVRHFEELIKWVMIYLKTEKDQTRIDLHNKNVQEYQLEIIKLKVA